MGQGALAVDDLVDVEEDRAGNMLGEIFRARILAFARHVPGGVDDHKIGRVELALELVGLNQPCLWRRQSHFSNSYLS